MSLLTIGSETLVNIANAIRAKTGKSATMTPAQMVTEIAAIPSGGGSLPSVISKIDGGEFTFATAASSAYFITHNLGVAPRGFVIWTDDVDITTAPNNTVIRGVFIVDETANGSITSVLYQLGVYNSNFNEYTRGIGSNYSGYANENRISYNVANAYYAASVTYRWFAWA